MPAAVAAAAVFDSVDMPRTLSRVGRRTGTARRGVDAGYFLDFLIDVTRPSFTMTW